MPSAPLSPTLLTAAPDYARRFGLIIAGLRAVVASGLLRHPILSLIILPLYKRLGRATRRFDRLMARIAAGRLPQPRKHTHSGKTIAKPAIPTHHGWLVRALGHHGAAYGSQLQYLLAEPGMAELLAVCPAAARIFRPLCRMLGQPDPAPRPPRPRPPRAVPPRDPTPRSLGLGLKADQEAGLIPKAMSLMDYYATPRPARAAVSPPGSPGPHWPWCGPRSTKPA